ncbi:hypothetical protein BGW36DRAFT_448786 [Talaromyces proteolyticus]|uniref:Uncharacterized protein n=1 Tax=Talaromyces proteolyticus TaxID=1131652 RepID=A0AAD4PWZ8_9EURO|nr:uncharacterized protein BGW36DRAFT_448786 [Talaromyces proteolyticus]KAH8698757.1 hypothetical protein BGW36DRAFT_448786 [Talaromyces proteolyticus]
MDMHWAPLCIVKRSRSPATEPKKPYRKEPVTPSRSSSINSDSQFNHIGSTLSASITPPLEGRQACLEVPKVRRSSGKSCLQPRKMGQLHSQLDDDSRVALAGDVREPCLLDPRTKAAIHNHGQNKHDHKAQHRISHFFHTLDKRLSSLSTHATSKRSLSHTISLRSNSRDSQYAKLDFKMQNCPAPISTVRMEMQTENSIQTAQDTELYIRIAITADVKLITGPFTQYNNYIEAVVLLNIMTVQDVDKVISMAQVVIDTLRAEDSLAVVCVNSEKNDFIEVLMPLSQGSNVDLRRLMSGYISLGRGLWKGGYDGNLLGDAINKASEILMYEHRLRHVFLVSVICDGMLDIADHSSVGFSTVTTNDRHYLGINPRLGWHVHCEMDANGVAISSLQHKLNKVVHHVRSAIAPGNITSLQLELFPGLGCFLQSQPKRSLDSLRPGECWKLIVKVKACKEHQINRLEQGIKSLLRCNDAEEDGDGAILSAKLAFKHSLLPFCSHMIAKSCHASEQLF